MSIKDYIFSLRKLFLFSFFIFLFSIIFGFFLAKSFPDIILQTLSALKAVYSQVALLDSFSQFLFVLFNNSFVLFLILLFSFFFGIFPFLVLFSNGVVLGALIYLLKGSLPISLFLASILPHGIFEIPVLIVGSAAGFKIANKTIKILFKKEQGLRKEIFSAFKFFLTVLIPFLVLAALIEIYFVPILLDKLSK